MRTFILAALAAAAQARGGSAPHVSSSGSTGQHCHTILSLNNDFSKLDVKGALNGHPIELSKKEEARPGGARVERARARESSRSFGAHARAKR